MFKIGIMGKPVCCLWEGADLRGLVLRIITKSIWLLPQLLQVRKLYDALTRCSYTHCSFGTSPRSNESGTHVQLLQLLYRVDCRCYVQNTMDNTLTITYTI